MWKNWGGHQKERFFMKYKRTCREVFQDQFKLKIRFWGIVVGKFKFKKWGDHQKKKIFILINNAGEAQILFKENHQGLMRLHAHLEDLLMWEKTDPVSKKRNFFWSEKMTYEEAFQNLLKSCLSFGGLCGVPIQKAGLVKILCDSPCMRIIWKLLNTLCWIFGTRLIKFCHKTLETLSFSLTLRWVKTRTKWCDWVITNYSSQTT